MHKKIYNKKTKKKHFLFLGLCSHSRRRVIEYVPAILKNENEVPKNHLIRQAGFPKPLEVYEPRPLKEDDVAEFVKAKEAVGGQLLY